MMQVATSSTPGSGQSYTEKAQRHKDGSVLLSVADDRICKLNGVGALTWMVLENNPTGVGVEDVVRELGTQFDAINAEGQLHYEVSPEQLRSDTARFLTKMVEMNLLVIDVDSGGQQFYYINDGVSGTTTSPATEFSSPRELPSETTQTDRLPLKRETFAAFIGLLAFDLLLKFRGFQSLIKRVESWPTAGPHTTERELCKRVRAMVDRAQLYYPKKAMCLQHSAVVTCLLRRRGIPAEMVLAAQEFPPKGHAWAEVEGEVVNDTQRVKAKYLELRRI